jgi:hypothetical protein
MTAVVLANNLKDTDADRQQKMLEIERNSNRALETMETGYVRPSVALSITERATRTSSNLGKSNGIVCKNCSARLNDDARNCSG